MICSAVSFEFEERFKKSKFFMSLGFEQFGPFNIIFRRNPRDTLFFSSTETKMGQKTKYDRSK